MKTCRLLLEGPPFDVVEIEWPINHLGLPLTITLTYAVGQEYPPNPELALLPAGTPYPPVRYKLMARPKPGDQSDPVASYMSQHNMTRYGPAEDEPAP
jgi:hypothetical protein